MDDILEGVNVGNAADAPRYEQAADEQLDQAAGAAAQEGAEDVKQETSKRRERMADPLEPSQIQYCVTVRGLAWQATSTTLVEVLTASQCAVQGTPLLSYDNSGLAIVPVASEDDIEKAIRCSGSMVGRRRVEVQRSSPEEYAQLYNDMSPVDGENLCVIRLSSLPLDATRGQVEDWLAGAGVTMAGQQGLTTAVDGVQGAGRQRALLNAVYLSPVLDSGRPSGYGYAITAGQGEASAAVEALAGRDMNGHTVLASITHKGEVYALLDVQQNRGLAADGDCACVVRVRGLPEGISRRDVDGWLASLPGMPQYRLTLVHAAITGKLSGEIAVEFAGEEEARAALPLLHGAAVQGSTTEARACLKYERYGLTGGTHKERWQGGDEYSVVHLLGLPFTVSPAQVQSFLLAVDTVPATPLSSIYILQRTDGKPGGEAFAVFQDEATATAAAAARDGADCGGRQVEARVVCGSDMWAVLARHPLKYKPKDKNRPAPPMLAGWSDGYPVASEDVDTFLRCRGVPFETAEDDVRRYFEGQAVHAVHLLQDDKDGKTRTLEAFVEFPDPAAALAALCRQKDSLSVAGGQPRYIELYPCNRREVQAVLARKAAPTLAGPSMSGKPERAARGGDDNCRKCGQPGHWARDCPTGGAGPSGSSDDTCRKCGKPGHWARDCPGGDSRRSGDTCNKCGRVGHWARDCPGQGGDDRRDRGRRDAYDRGRDAAYGDRRGGAPPGYPPYPAYPGYPPYGAPGYGAYPSYPPAPGYGAYGYPPYGGYGQAGYGASSGRDRDSRDKRDRSRSRSRGRSRSRSRSRSAGRDRHRDRDGDRDRDRGRDSDRGNSSSAYPASSAYPGYNGSAYGSYGAYGAAGYGQGGYGDSAGGYGAPAAGSYGGQAGYPPSSFGEDKGAGKGEGQARGGAFGTTGDDTCRKCGQSGHWARECPNGATGGGGDDTCRKCGKSGHWARECPEAGGGRGGDDTCRKCGQSGHWARDCPNGGGGGGRDDNCRKCGKPGHWARDCPGGY